MIAVDTNVLLRYLLADDPVQTPRATRLIEDAADRGEDVFVSQIVLCETEWVLDSIYGASRQEIYSILKRLLAARPFALQDSQTVVNCLELYGEKKGDFSDYLIGAAAQVTGAGTTFTFDKKLKQDPEFTPL